ncbi:MAG TPA: hypothetical protein VMN58_12040 [Acidimicrobiales bacterium]|nr:hypothetical protein [Acidimicrobiales bacterium]
METAAKILVVYGTVSLTVGFLLGIPLSQVRSRVPEAPRHLVTAHLSAIIQGAVHLGLSVAVAFSSLTAWLETTAAGLLVTGSALFVAGAIANWRQDIGDHFAVRSLGWKLLATSSAGHLPGMAIVLIGVLTAL